MSATVLVIDDEPMFQDLTRSVLSIGNHRVEVASNGFEALKLLGQIDFDVVIIDYHLPEMDGYALARLLIEHTRFRHRRPVLLAVTADPHGLAGRRGSDVIFAAILEKPIAPRRLLDVIAVAMRPDPDMAELTSAATSLVANPDPRLAMEASRAFWRSAGLPDRPRAVVVPPPSRDQVAALSICFDLGDAAQADLIVSTDPSVLAEHAVDLGPAAHLLPVVGVNRVESSAVDLEFSIPDRASWHRTASMIRDFTGRRARLQDDVRLSAEADIQLLSYLFVHGRSWMVGCEWPSLPLAPGRERRDLVRDLVASELVRPCVDGSDVVEPAPMGLERLGIRDHHPKDALLAPEGETTTPPPRQHPQGPSLMITETSHEILVLEHNLLGRDIMKDLIEVAGRSVGFAGSEAEIARTLDAGGRTVVILPVDAWPPVGPAGPLILARAHGPRHGTVIATVSDHGGLADTVMASGCVDGVLPRPIRPRALLDLLDAADRAAGQAATGFDDAIHRDLVDVVGQGTVKRLHATFAAQLQANLVVGTDAASNADRLRSEAHGMKAAAAMLGFKNLSRLCEHLEQECARHEDVIPTLSQIALAKQRALAKIQELSLHQTSGLDQVA